jgi:hypothetical protein
MPVNNISNLGIVLKNSDQSTIQIIGIRGIRDFRAGVLSHQKVGHWRRHQNIADPLAAHNTK